MKSSRIATRASLFVSFGVVVWCIGVSLVVYFSPIFSTTHKATKSGVADVNNADERIYSFSDWAGGGGFVMLAIPCALAVASLLLIAYGRGLSAVAVAALMLAFSFITGFSVGRPYFAASVVQLLAAAFALFASRGDRRWQTAS